MGPNEYVYEVEIPDLEPDKTYVIQVKATNTFDEGEWSAQFEFETSGRGEEIKKIISAKKLSHYHKIY